MQFEINEARVKSLAWSVKNYLATKGQEVSNTMLLEALSQGLGYSDFRTLKATAGGEGGKTGAGDIVTTYAQQARQLMKGDRSVNVHFGTYYTDASYQPAYPLYATLVLTEARLARLLALRDQVAREKLSELAVREGFVVNWQDEGEFSVSYEELVVDYDEMYARLSLEHEDGEVHTKPWYFANLSANLEGRKPGEPLFIEITAAEIDELDVKPATEKGRYLVADHWGHCFVGSKETIVSFVFDMEANRVTHMLVGGELAHRDEMADVTDSLLNANEDVFDNPEEYGSVGYDDELPDWAMPKTKQARPKAAPAVSGTTQDTASGPDEVRKALREQLKALGFEVSDVADWVFEAYGMDFEFVVAEQANAWIREFIERKSKISW
jgi:hypothetical protein